MLELILQFSGVAGSGWICGGQLCGGRSGGSCRRAGAGSGHGLRLDASLETGLQIVVVAGRGFHIVALSLLRALLVVQIDESVAFLQYLCRLGGIARDAVCGDGVVGALSVEGKEGLDTESCEREEALPLLFTYCICMTVEGVEGAVHLVAGIQCAANPQRRQLDLAASGQEVAIDAATRVLRLNHASRVRCTVILGNQIRFTNVAGETGYRDAWITSSHSRVQEQTGQAILRG